MGKRIIQQARGKGSLSYRVRRRAYSVKPSYPGNLNGEYEVIKLITSAGHTSPVVKLRNKKGEIFYNLANKGLYEGQVIKTGGSNDGDVSKLDELKNGTKIFNIENQPNDGGKFIRSGGNAGIILGRKEKKIIVLMPSKQEKYFYANCRATVGETAGQGRLDKPILKAGKQHFIKKSRNKLWPRTSAIKMNAIDHPFGSGRGKRPKSKIAQRFSSPGQKVGLVRPRRTGRKK